MTANEEGPASQSPPAQLEPADIALPGWDVYTASRDVNLVHVDPGTEKERRSLEQEEKTALIERLRKETEGLGQDIQERKKYANRLYWMICCWLVALFAVLGLEGWQGDAFDWGDNILITLITGTTANVIGIFIVVANYLFPKPK